MIELVPYSSENFKPEYLAIRLNNIVSENRSSLLARGLVGLVERYGASPGLALENVHKGMADHDNGVSEHLVVVDESGDPQSTASVAADSLRKLRVPILPKLAVGPLARHYTGPGKQIKTWTSETGPERPLLSATYQALGQRVSAREIAYTLEPVRARPGAHEAITQSGMSVVETARFDDGEDWKIPPDSHLYISSNPDEDPFEALVMLRGGLEAEILKHNQDGT